MPSFFPGFWYKGGVDNYVRNNPDKAVNDAGCENDARSMVSPKAPYPPVQNKKHRWGDDGE